MSRFVVRQSDCIIPDIKHNTIQKPLRSFGSLNDHAGLSNTLDVRTGSSRKVAGKSSQVKGFSPCVWWCMSVIFCAFMLFAAVISVDLPSTAKPTGHDIPDEIKHTMDMHKQHDSAHKPQEHPKIPDVKDMKHFQDFAGKTQN